MISWILFGLSAIVNILLIWYIRSLMNRILQLPSGLNKLRGITEEYLEYLKYLYSLETFHGEPVVQELIGRTKVLSKNIQNNCDIFNIVMGDSEVDDDVEEEESDSNEEKDGAVA